VHRAAFLLTETSVCGQTGLLLVQQMQVQKPLAYTAKILSCVAIFPRPAIGSPSRHKNLCNASNFRKPAIRSLWNWQNPNRTFAATGFSSRYWRVEMCGRLSNRLGNMKSQSIV
jgi:hypothetical protein